MDILRIINGCANEETANTLRMEERQFEIGCSVGFESIAKHPSVEYQRQWFVWLDG